MELFSIPLLTTAICVIICWAMFAIFCSMVHEAISQINGERGRFMKKWLLKQLLDRPNGVNWASLLYMHGSVDLLTRSVSKPTGDIEPRLFAETLIEVVGNSQLVQLSKAAALSELTYRSDVLNNFKAATLVLKPSDVVSFYQKAMHSAELCSHPDGRPDETEIYKCLVLQVQHWYMDMSGRLTWWYKKRTRARLFALGALTALVLNLDSVELFDHFGASAGSKKTIMDFYEANADRLADISNHTTDLKTIDTLQKKIIGYGLLMDSVAQTATLPIGWPYSILNKNAWAANGTPEHDAQPKQIYYVYAGFSELISSILISKLFGLLISGLAAGFGAPFWFDLLRKIYSRNPQA